MPADLEETLAPGPLAEAVAHLALDKARAVAARLREGIVLGADTRGQRHQDYPPEKENELPSVWCSCTHENSGLVPQSPTQIV